MLQKNFFEKYQPNNFFFSKKYINISLWCHRVIIAFSTMCEKVALICLLLLCSFASGQLFCNVIQNANSNCDQFDTCNFWQTNDPIAWFKSFDACKCSKYNHTDTYVCHVEGEGTYMVSTQFNEFKVGDSNYPEVPWHFLPSKGQWVCTMRGAPLFRKKFAAWAIHNYYEHRIASNEQYASWLCNTESSAAFRLVSTYQEKRTCLQFYSPYAFRDTGVVFMTYIPLLPSMKETGLRITNEYGVKPRGTMCQRFVETKTAVTRSICDFSTNENLKVLRRVEIGTVHSSVGSLYYCRIHYPSTFDVNYDREIYGIRIVSDLGHNVSVFRHKKEMAFFGDRRRVKTFSCIFKYKSHDNVRRTLTLTAVDALRNNTGERDFVSKVLLFVCLFCYLFSPPLFVFFSNSVIQWGDSLAGGLYRLLLAA